MTYSGYDVETQLTDAMDRDSIKALAEKAASLGPVMYFIDTAGHHLIRLILNIS